MNRSLYIFNPDHDLALANGDANFNPPVSARTFASDLAALPLWYASPDSFVWARLEDSGWLTRIQDSFPQLSDIYIGSNPDNIHVKSVHPWGWNKSVCKKLAESGIGDSILPDFYRLDKIRELSHRRIAVQALRFIREDDALSPGLPLPAKLLDGNQIDEFAQKYSSVVFKAPWSGSGKGLYWATAPVSESIRGWCRKIAKKQGCVVGEEVYNKLQDFAMEFLCDRGNVSFAGYSLFETENGTYKSNELLSDEMIVERLTAGGLTSDLLQRVRSRLVEFIQNEIAMFYSGYLGVDMFVYEKEGRVMLHPCVEINLRMTMGLVARMFYDRYVLRGKTGRFVVDHFSQPGFLKQDHLKRMSDFPLVVEDGRIVKGYLSLTPVTEHTFYRVRVEI
ncbi:hypothetical protein [Parabacteroides sp. FAFU027]|uniref:hypothetical protein n=1 Tax=Parabacteroides sp. FAFU027 TaxID=2922715 RepID=UPI001FAF7C54|nr:hypothetical protein [Parabacteroides sp. FAFU027]